MGCQVIIRGLQILMSNNLNKNYKGHFIDQLGGSPEYEHIRLDKLA